MSVGFHGRESGFELLGRSTQNSVRKREFKVAGVELLHVRSLGISIGNNTGTDNLDGTSTATMTTSHIVVYKSGINNVHITY